MVLINFDNYKLGHYYDGKNINGSSFIFKVTEKTERVVTIEIVDDRDAIPFRIRKGNCINLYINDDDASISNCFTHIKEIPDERVLALIL